MPFSYSLLCGIHTDRWNSVALEIARCKPCSRPGSARLVCGRGLWISFATTDHQCPFQGKRESGAPWSLVILWALSPRSPFTRTQGLRTYFRSEMYVLGGPCCRCIPSWRWFGIVGHISFRFRLVRSQVRSANIRCIPFQVSIGPLIVDLSYHSTY